MLRQITKMAKVLHPLITLLRVASSALIPMKAEVVTGNDGVLAKRFSIQRSETLRATCDDYSYVLKRVDHTVINDGIV
jgi:hypothetical protein